MFGTLIEFLVNINLQILYIGKNFIYFMIFKSPITIFNWPQWCNGSIGDCGSLGVGSIPIYGPYSIFRGLAHIACRVSVTNRVWLRFRYGPFIKIYSNGKRKTSHTCAQK